jgi:ribosomal protein L7/L12
VIAGIPEDQLAQITEALFRGQKIEAIRQYRNCTGAVLAEAKAAVERLEADLRAAEPDKFAEGAGG